MAAWMPFDGEWRTVLDGKALRPSAYVATYARADGPGLADVFG